MMKTLFALSLLVAAPSLFAAPVTNAPP